MTWVISFIWLKCNLTWVAVHSDEIHVGHQWPVQGYIPSVPTVPCLAFLGANAFTPPFHSNGLPHEEIQKFAPIHPILNSANCLDWTWKELCFLCNSMYVLNWAKVKCIVKLQRVRTSFQPHCRGGGWSLPTAQIMLSSAVHFISFAMLWMYIVGGGRGAPGEKRVSLLCVDQQKSCDTKICTYICNLTIVSF